MCGIVGFTGQENPVRLKGMLSAVAHRGPDDEGVFVDRGISLGHKRLSIIDLETGAQPQHSADRRWTLIYNGELYNYRELRARLEQAGQPFTTSSDTEVLLHWVRAHGVDGLKDLNGMFAFALWDRDARSLLLARDRLGIKPLYYAFAEQRLVFASEIKALLEWLPERKADDRALFEFLTFQNVLSDRTFLEGVHKLPAGQWLRWTPERLERGTFWDIEFRSDGPGRLEDAAQAYRETLDRAVKRHLVSDVPVGSYLSSGFDSCAVATSAARQLGETLHSFTGAFTDAPYYDEREGSRAVANAVGAKLHEVEIRDRDYVDHIERVIWHLDEPTLGTGALPQFVVSKLVSEHVKVVLTGHGGDELFAGYQVNQVALVRDTLRARPRDLLGVLRGIRSDEWSRVLYYLLFPLIQPEVRHGLFIMTPERRRRSCFTREFLDRIGEWDPFERVRQLVDGRGYSAGQKLTVLYLKTYLPTLLIQEDKVGMAHSIEARMPICDNEVIDLALSIPFATKLADGLKSVPRTAMRGVLPERLWQMPKRGFPTPFARWQRSSPVRELVEDLLLGPRAAQRGIFDAGGVRRAFERSLRSRTDNLADYALANRLYSIGVVELWFRLFIDR